jgi:hypothetical protein
VNGPIDPFLLFLHWLRNGTSFEKIGAGFQLSWETRRERLIEIVTAIRGPMMDRFITPAARAPFAAREEPPDC